MGTRILPRTVRWLVLLGIYVLVVVLTLGTAGCALFAMASTPRYVDSDLTSSCFYFRPGSLRPIQPIGEYVETHVEVREIVWQAASCDITIRPWSSPDAGDEISVDILGEGWHEIAEAASEGGVILGVAPNEQNFDLNVAIAGTPAAPVLLPRCTSADFTDQLRGFMRHDANPLRGEPLERLLIAWNEETDSPAHRLVGIDGPIGASFRDYLFHRRDAERSWAARPPSERFLPEAPGEILRDMAFAEVWIHVQAPYRFAGEVLCAATPTGSEGCQQMDVDRAEYLTALPGWTLPGESVTIEIFEQDDAQGGSGWWIPFPQARIESTVIESDLMSETGRVLVTLDERRRIRIGSLARRELLALTERVDVPRQPPDPVLPASGSR